MRKMFVCKFNWLSVDILCIISQICFKVFSLQKTRDRDRKGGSHERL